MRFATLLRQVIKKQKKHAEKQTFCIRQSAIAKKEICDCKSTEA